MVSDDKILKGLSVKRGILRGQITKLENKVTNQSEGWDKIDINLHLSKAKAAQVDLKSLDGQIFDIHMILDCYNEDELAELAEADEVYHDKLFVIISQLENLANPVSQTLNNVPPVQPTAQSSQRIKLPAIELPKFGNVKGENLSKFLRTLDTILADSNCKSSHQKFMYLKGQLYGAPLTVIESFIISDYTSCYEDAKTLLTEAFDSADKSKFSTISTLSNLKMGFNEAPYDYIGTMRTVQEEIKNQKMQVDDFVRFFVWNGFNKPMQLHLTQITNKSTPTLDEINRNIFEAADRYTKQIADRGKNHGQSKPNDAYAHATNVQSHNRNIPAENSNTAKERPKVFCILCAADKKPKDHLLKDCKVYPTAKDKFNQLRQINACTKCGFSHSTAECKFRFRNPCKNCGKNGNHFAYLCQKAAVPSLDSKEGNVATDTTSTAASIEASQSLVVTNNILPTFTGLIIGKDFSHEARVFKDSGCTNTLICEQLSDALGLPVETRNVPLNIRGINSVRQIKTKIVKLRMKIGDTTFNHKAICIPQIKTRFNANGVGEIVSSFVDKGYVMADKSFSPTTTGFIENIDIILGTDGEHMIPLKTCFFGNKNDADSLSAYLDTPIGVILSGSTDKISSNLSYLPDKSAVTANAAAVHPSHNADIDVSQCNPTMDNDVIDEGFSHPPIEITLNKCVTEILVIKLTSQVCWMQN